MNVIINHIEKLSKTSKYIKLYRNFDTKVILRNMGKITGEVDKQYIRFLMETNGASILDYCFLGMKNNQLGINVYDNIRELWQVDNLLTFRFWGVIGTSCGENFGYLDKIDSDGNHFIGYYNTNEPEQVYLVASSFDVFMSKFLKQIENTLKLDENAICIANNDWFLNKEKLIVDDEEMNQYLQNHKTSKYDLLSK
ncbi:SMI1/KNR4 family protein [Bacteroides fragilis]